MPWYEIEIRMKTGISRNRECNRLAARPLSFSPKAFLPLFDPRACRLFSSKDATSSQGDAKGGAGVCLKEKFPNDSGGTLHRLTIENAKCQFNMAAPIVPICKQVI